MKRNKSKQNRDHKTLIFKFLAMHANTGMQIPNKIEIQRIDFLIRLIRPFVMMSAVGTGH